MKRIISMLLIVIMALSMALSNDNTSPVYASSGNAFNASLYQLTKLIDTVKQKSGAGAKYVNDSTNILVAGYVVTYVEATNFYIDVYYYVTVDTRKVKKVKRVKSYGDILEVFNYVNDGIELVNRPSASNEMFNKATKMGFNNFGDIVENYYKLKYEDDLKTLASLSRKPFTSQNYTSEVRNTMLSYGIDIDTIYKYVFSIKPKIVLNKSSYSRESSDSVQITVNARDTLLSPLKYTNINISMTTPDGKIKMIKTVKSLNNSSFVINYPLSPKSSIGTYKIITTVDRIGYNPGSAEITFKVK